MKFQLFKGVVTVLKQLKSGKRHLRNIFSMLLGDVFLTIKHFMLSDIRLNKLIILNN